MGSEADRAAPALLAPEDLRGIRGVLTDVDDTLTREGKLSASTYRCLWQLHEAGIDVVPVTGRSYGWAHMMLAQWPVPAVVTESGGVALWREAGAGAASTLRVDTFDEPQQVQQQRERLMDLCAQWLRDAPGLRFASDNELRRVDVAIDYCEEVPRVPMAQVLALIEKIRGAGFQARHSTVHINAWHGHFDKGPMALRLLQQWRGIDTRTAGQDWLFIGDAPNDRSMFASFPRSVGVANITPFLSDLGDARPARLTRASHGAGFEEMAALLLAAR